MKTMTFQKTKYLIIALVCLFMIAIPAVVFAAEKEGPKVTIVTEDAEDQGETITAEIDGEVVVIEDEEAATAATFAGSTNPYFSYNGVLITAFAVIALTGVLAGVRYGTTFSKR